MKKKLKKIEKEPSLRINTGKEIYYYLKEEGREEINTKRKESIMATIKNLLFIPILYMSLLTVIFAFILLVEIDVNIALKTFTELVKAFYNITLVLCMATCIILITIHILSEKKLKRLEKEE